MPADEANDRQRAKRTAPEEKGPLIQRQIYVTSVEDIQFEPRQKVWYDV